MPHCESGPGRVDCRSPASLSAPTAGSNCWGVSGAILVTPPGWPVATRPSRLLSLWGAKIPSAIISTANMAGGR
jgi:hypothetical protein